MRNILLVFVVIAFPVSTAVAASNPLAPQKPSRAATSDKPLPLKRSGENSCAAYGPGFAKVNGSDSCVKVGGDMSVSVRGGR